MIIVYSITDQESYDSIRGWVESCNQHCKPDVVKFIVGTKVDCEHEREVSKEQGQQLANELECEFCEVSSKDGRNIPSLLNTVALYCMKVKEESRMGISSNVVDLKQQSSRKRKRKCCK